MIKQWEDADPFRGAAENKRLPKVLYFWSSQRRWLCLVNHFKTLFLDFSYKL